MRANMFSIWSSCSSFDFGRKGPCGIAKLLDWPPADAIDGTAIRPGAVLRIARNGAPGSFMFRLDLPYIGTCPRCKRGEVQARHGPRR